MASVSALWLPVLLSAVFVFVASSIIHMVLPWHNSDYPKMPDEDRFREALRPLALTPGDYFVPRGEGMKDMKNPAFIEKLNQGPTMVMTVMPNGMTRSARCRRPGDDGILRLFGHIGTLTSRRGIYVLPSLAGAA